MKGPLIIRRATPADVRAIWEIEQASFPAPWSRWAILGELANPVSVTLIAGTSPPTPWKLLGYVIFWVAAEEMHLLNLAVHPQHRSQGIARRLLTEALNQARQKGAQIAWLEVRPSNAPALNLYNSFGFKTAGRRPKYYRETQEDALILAYAWEEEG
jgi:ribosomal-protein-alanine N-acetyltransferase